jgi:TetR/AcrR family transcriptional regulator, transcriptional repressor for nem operon
MGKGDLTRQRIIEDVAPVFNRHGYGSTSMSELMAATGLEKGGLYRHFKSKEDLALEAFEHASRVIEKARLSEISEIESPIERIEALVTKFVNARSPIPGGCPVFNAAVEHDDGNPKLRAGAKDFFQRWVAQLTKWVTEAQEAGEFSKLHRAKDVATFLYCTLEGALIARNLLGSPEPLLSAERVLMDFLLAGRIRKKSQKKLTTNKSTRSLKNEKQHTRRLRRR